MKKSVTYTYHHMGIPSNEKRAGERYSPTYKMHTTDGNNPFRIQWHRFEPDSPLHPLIKEKPHVAFKVDDLDVAIKGETVILDPYYPFENFRVAIIEVDNVPIELIETTLSEEEIWATDNKSGSKLYPEET